MKVLVRITTVIFLLAACVFIALNAPVNRNIRNQEFTIVKGESGLSIAAKLKKAGLIRNERFFAGLSLITGRSHSLQKGLYLLNDNMSSGQILSFIAHGKVYTVRITIPEGYIIRQIAEVLKSKKLIASEADFIYLAKSGNNLYTKRSFLKGPDLEGFLFPDTYDIPKTAGMNDILILMVSRFSNAIIAPNIQAIRNNPMPFYDILRVASIVEKEARVPADRPIVAQVYLKRLRKNYNLGSCPTVEYAVGKYRGEHLSYKDLKVDSPYNTYIHPGLPPTPVSNPGVKSFRAVLNPADTDYLYFVSKNDGTHYFSRTLIEHNAAVDRYQRKKQDAQ